MTFIGHFQSNPFYDSKSGSLDVFIEGIIFFIYGSDSFRQHRLWREIKRADLSSTFLEKPQKPQDTEAVKADIK